jgi:hypothetical protein
MKKSGVHQAAGAPSGHVGGDERHHRQHLQLAARVTGSRDGTPNRNARSAFPTPIANGRPMASPMAVTIIAAQHHRSHLAWFGAAHEAHANLERAATRGREGAQRAA